MKHLDAKKVIQQGVALPTTNCYVLHVTNHGNEMTPVASGYKVWQVVARADAQQSGTREMRMQQLRNILAPAHAEQISMRSLLPNQVYQKLFDKERDDVSASAFDVDGCVIMDIGSMTWQQAKDYNIIGLFARPPSEFVLTVDFKNLTTNNTAHKFAVGKSDRDVMDTPLNVKHIGATVCLSLLFGTVSMAWEETPAFPTLDKITAFVLLAGGLVVIVAMMQPGGDYLYKQSHDSFVPATLQQYGAS